MNQFEQIELDDLVPQASFDEAAEAVRNDVSDEGGGRLKRAIAGLAAPRIGAAMAAQLRQIDLLRLFVEGWGKSPEIAAVAQETEASNAPRFVRLGKLEQNLDLNPLLTVSAWGLSSSPLKFTLSMQAEFEAVEIGISSGHVVEIAGGFCRLSALLKFGQFSFPSGIAPKELQLGSGRRFEKPGVPLLPQHKAKPAA